MENEKLIKVKKSSKTVAKVANVFMVVLIVFAALTMLLSFTLRYYAKMDPEKAAKVMEYSESDRLYVPKLSTNGILSFGIDERDYDNVEDYNNALSMASMILSITLAAGAVVFGYIKKAFKTIVKEETPFCENVMRSMKVSFIVASVISVLFIDLVTGILLAVFSLFVYRIMDYGFVLQTLSDETL